jgi:GNAT superfamily N-acetyltransferase
MAGETQWPLRRLTSLAEADIQGLARVLVDCVAGGASVSFMSPLSMDRACAFWRQIAGRVAGGERALLICEDSNGIVGTVQLVLDLPENQPHRAEVSKMLVHRRARRKGVGAALLLEVENLARDLGKSLLVLDTADAQAARLYLRLGWVRVGVVPDYALLPDGAFCDTTFFYRRLEPSQSHCAGSAARMVD